MATFTPVGTKYGVNTDTLTRMYNPGANQAGLNSVTPWNSVEDFHQNTVGRIFNSSQTPTTQVATPTRQYDWSTPSEVDTGFKPLAQTAAPAMLNPVSANPLNSNAGSQFSSSALSANVAPINLTAEQFNNISTLPGNQTNNSMFSGFGDILGKMWEGMEGWQGLQSGLQTATGIFEAYQGMENLDHQKDVFSFQKDAWQANYDMQKDAYDRQVAQVDSRKSFLQRGGSQLEENQ